MLEGYKPIDFSSIFDNQPDLSQMRNRVGLSQAAMNILANSSFGNVPLSDLKKQGLNLATGKVETPKRKQTLWGRAVDLLSTPVYAISNAADDALAGHQSSDTDSVLQDSMQILGGLVTGAGRGIGTGLRGAFAPSEIAADPMDKQYLGDFLIRWDTHMSAQDALDPKNREEVRKRLANKKINMFSDDDRDKYFYDWDKGKVEVTDEDIDQYFQDMHIYGLGASMVADPLNFVKGPTGIFRGAKGSAEVPEVITNTKNTYEGFKSLPEGVTKNTKPVSISPGSMAVGKSPGSYKVNLSPGAIQNKIANPATGELITPPAWFNEVFPSSPSAISITRTTREVPGSPVANATDPLDEMLNSWAPGRANKADRPVTDKSRESIFPVAKIPNAQIHAAQKFSNPTEVSKLTNDLLKRIVSGEGFDNAIARLSTKYPGVPFTRTTQLLEHVSKIPDFTKRLGIPAERKKIVGAFARVINADAEAMKIPPKIKPAEVILNEASTVGPVALNKLVEGARGVPPVASKNPTRDAKIVDDLVKQFEGQLNLTQIPAGIRNPAKYKAAMQTHGTLTGPKQVNVWNALTSKQLVNVKTPARFAKALNLLKQVEERFIAMGHKPMSSTPKAGGSVPLRLSQVIEAIGPAVAAMDKTLLTKILRGDPDSLKGLAPEAIQKIEELKAGESLVEASSVAPVVDNAVKNAEELIKGPLSAARIEEIVTIESKVAEDIAQSATAGSMVRDKLTPKSPGDGFPVTNTTALISHPDVSSKLLKRYSSAPAVARVINTAIGGLTPRQLGKLSGPSARTMEWIGARFNAAYKNADMRPLYLRNAATAKATVARRAEYLNRLAKKYDVNDADLWNDALKAAQGRMAALPGSQAEELSKEIISIMENLFGSSGLKSSIALENSVVGRSQLFMKELNQNLRRFGLGQYQFSKAGDYSEGVKWLNSWESWKIERPIEFLFRVQNVVEHTVREKIMFDEIIARFGTYTKGGEFTHQITNHPRLAGVYFGKVGAEQATQFVKNLKAISQPSSKNLQHFDKVVSKWKAGVTIYVPSHHIRNLIGDIYFNWLAGVNSTRPYGSAMRVMQSQKGRYEGLEQMDALTNPDALKKLLTTGHAPSATGKQTALTMKNGTNVTNDMVYVSAFQQGILPTTRVLEDIPDDVATGLERIKPLGGKGQKTAHRISEGRDHYIRLAHYIDALKKSSKPFEQAVEDAAATVRKWHPDGMDLTAFERNVMRRMFPFYSWTRKAMPLIIESLVATPGKVMAYPKAQYMLQNMLGIQTGPMSDPFPQDQLFPDWIREKGIGPITAGNIPLIGGMFGAPDDYTVVNPGNPSMDLISQFNNPGKMAMGMINPAARIPIELATGREAQTGAPIDGITDTDYIVKQIPGLSHAGRATGEFGVSDTTKENSSGINFQNIFNMLTAMGVQNTKPYVKSAEFDLRDYLKGLRQ
jgi:hypothetical protein